MYKRTHSYVILAASFAAAAVLALQAPIPQPPGYHDFADQRSWLGIPNALNVLSNIPFLLVGMWGAYVACHPRTPAQRAFLLGSERWAYLVLFTGVAAVCFGSGYYHWSPQNQRLAWDRLPMSVGFMGLLAATISERTRAEAGARLLAPLVAFGIVSVAYWHASEVWGRGDLRLYIAAQYGSLLLVLTMSAVFPPRYTHSRWVMAAVAMYALAKVFEAFDKAVFDSLGVSGHTIKHLVAAAGVVPIVIMLQRRSALARDLPAR